MIQREIPNPYKSLYRTLIIAAFVMNIPAVISMMSGNTIITMYLGMAQFIMFIVGVIFLISGKQEVRGILRLLEGNLLAHWTYEQFHWKKSSEMEFHRQRQNAMSTMLVFLLVGPLAGWFGFNGMTLMMGITLGTLLGIFSFGIGMIYASSVLKKSKKPPFEAFISDSAAFINGIFVDWSSTGISLIRAKISSDQDTGSPSLLITYSVRGRYGVQERELFVPIPNDKSQEAHTVVKKLNQYRKQ